MANDDEVMAMGGRDRPTSGSTTLMCQQLRNARSDEQSAQGEYQRLIDAANAAGHSEVSAGTKMVQEQENTHEQFFNQMYDLHCR